MLIGGTGDVAPYELFIRLPELELLPKSDDLVRTLLLDIMPVFKEQLLSTLTVHTHADTIRDFGTDIIIAFKGRCYLLSLSGNGNIEILEESLPAGFGSGGKYGLLTYNIMKRTEALIKLLKNEEESKKHPLIFERKLETMLLSAGVKEAAKWDTACDANVDITYE